MLTLPVRFSAFIRRSALGQSRARSQNEGSTTFRPGVSPRVAAAVTRMWPEARCRLESRPGSRAAARRGHLLSPRASPRPRTCRSMSRVWAPSRRSAPSPSMSDRAVRGTLPGGQQSGPDLWRPLRGHGSETGTSGGEAGSPAIHGGAEFTPVSRGGRDRCRAPWRCASASRPTAGRRPSRRSPEPCRDGSAPRPR
jgi:hypothetical protein